MGRLQPSVDLIAQITSSGLQVASQRPRDGAEVRLPSPECEGLVNWHVLLCHGLQELSVRPPVPAVPHVSGVHQAGRELLRGHLCPRRKPGPQGQAEDSPGHLCTICNDCCCLVCCGPCAICQLDRELTQ